jgi:hypothetical protein
MTDLPVLQDLFDVEVEKRSFLHYRSEKIDRRLAVKGEAGEGQSLRRTWDA